MKLEIPPSPEAITSEWLTAALTPTGSLDGAKVNGFDAETIGVGAGFLGKLARLTLQYDRDAKAAPRTVVAKFPVLDVESREIAMLFRFYEREIRFYQEIAPRVSLRIPRAFHADIDTASGDFVLLMEDMAPARVGDQLDSCTPRQAACAIRDIAAFHAEWWMRPELESLSWMPCINDPINQSAEQAYQDAWQPFLDHMGDKVGPELRQTGERLATEVCAILDALAVRPRTIVHGDYRLDNMFFGGDAGDELGVVDWQIANRAVGTFDVAYFVTGNIPVEDRRAHEQAWLHDYHDILVEGGVTGYDFEQCTLDYRLSALFCLVYNVVGIGTLDFGNERGLRLFDEWTARTAAAIADLDCDSVFP